MERLRGLPEASERSAAAWPSRVPHDEVGPGEDLVGARVAHLARGLGVPDRLVGLADLQGDVGDGHEEPARPPGEVDHLLDGRERLFPAPQVEESLRVELPDVADPGFSARSFFRASAASAGPRRRRTSPRAAARGWRSRPSGRRVHPAESADAGCALM